MANSSPAAADTPALATEYNDLRDDVLDPSTGHRHGGGADEGAPLLGTFTTGSPAYLPDTSYLADTDLFLIVYHTGTGTFTVNSDAANPPTTPLSIVSASGNACVPVKKGNYWKVVTGAAGGSTTIYTQSIGA